MTTVVILLLGLGSVLIVSAIESNPDGSDVSVIQTVKDVWDDTLNFQQGNTPSAGSTGTPNGVPSGPPQQLAANAAATSQIQSSAL
jgi:hypothetical protein